jgi:hypothetical protein
MNRFKQPSARFNPTVAFALGEGWVAVGEQTKEDLERFCQLLNSTGRPELSQHLRELVKVWQDSGPNLNEMMSAANNRLHPDAIEYLENQFTVFWNPTSAGRARLIVMPDYERLEKRIGRKRIFTEKSDRKQVLKPEAEALREFGFFTLNPHCEELAGPCARCGNYYVKKRASQKVYCSRSCGNAATAVVRTAAKVKAERDEKMVRAKALIRKWNALKGRSGLVWKVWLRKQEPSITDKFVTRRVNTGELPEPKAGRKP